MPELLGIIAPLRKFLSNSDESIFVQVEGAQKEVLSLKTGRKYIVPDFQREIRWDRDNLLQLIEDINTGPKYLGNVILTKRVDSEEYLVIDGQQRITVLTMILSCLEHLHSDHIETINPCCLKIESFSGFTYILSKNFPSIDSIESEIIDTDHLHQIGKYYYLWNQIKEIKHIIDRYAASSFIENLGKSNVNIILNKSDDLKDGIRYFIDVNLKGKQLDTEDIFKGYLFRNDSGSHIRREWYKLKTNVARIEQTKMKYPLLKLLEHYFFCDLYNERKFKGLVFDENFLLKNEFKMHQGSAAITYRAQTHLIEVINDNIYMLKSLKALNKAIDVMLNIVSSDSTSLDFNNLFSCVDENGTFTPIDATEKKVFHNFLSKMLKDDKILPKALVMKYILTTLLLPEHKLKAEYRKIYGVYLLSVLFVIFENNKSKDVFMGVLKASNIQWYEEIINQINSYFAPDRVTDNKIISQFKQGTNEAEDDYRFRCKSLATIYNFFRIQGDKVVINGGVNDIKTFVTNDDMYTTEHFIISEPYSFSMKVFISGEQEEYTLAKEVHSKFVNSLFNFIFINQTLNTRLENYWLPKKMQILEEEAIECQYSNMVISHLKTIKEHMEKEVDSNNYKDKLDLFFSRDFKDLYIIYARNVLNSVISTIKNESGECLEES